MSKSEEMFQKYYHTLIWQILYSRAHLQLWQRLENYKSSHHTEMNQARYFFNLTIQAHQDNTLMALSRVIRKQEGSLTIWKFLDFIEQNLAIFSDEAFLGRQKKKTGYDESWDKSHTPITQKEIEEDKRELKSLEDTTNRLITWRDKIIAHLDLKAVVAGTIFSKEYPIKSQQLQDVIEALFNILNKYSNAYDASTFYEKLPGEDDVQFVMESIRSHLQELKRDIS